MSSRKTLLSFLFGALFLATGAHADNPPSELDAAFDAAGKVATHGPADIKLGDQATLKLPAEHVYVPPKEAANVMRAMGNYPSPSLLGAIFPEKDGGWFVVMNFHDSGYIKDDDAKDWNAAELLQSLKDGTEEANKDRKARGIAEMEIIGWVEAPHYEKATHQLVWSVSSRDKGTTSNDDLGINYNTYTLGREGYISMNLVTGLNVIEKNKPVAHTLLAGLDFGSGKRYADFNNSTDKVAAYGLTALIAGAAAKKLGLLAGLGVLLVKFWKIAMVAILAGGGAIGKLFKRKKDSDMAA
jgi:uncharacterized membrane-anchored protein